MSDADTAGASLTQHRVPLRDVERELTRMMKKFQGQATLQRARMSNLVIFCSTLEKSIEINEQIPEISAAHPARVLLLVGEPGVERDVSARITVRPVGRGSKPYALAEQVTLHAGGGAVDRLPFAVRSLLIGDLPVNLWWATPTPPPFAGSLLYELGELAQQITYDSLGWPDPAKGMAATASWLEQVQRPGGRWRVASDFNWRRLKYWRRMVSQTLDPVNVAAAEQTISEVVIEHGPHAVIQGWLLASWLSRRLGWRLQAGKLTPGVEMAWRFITLHGESSVRIRRKEDGPSTILSLRIACQPAGKPLTFVIAHDGPQRLSLFIEGIDTSPRTITLPPQSPIDLVARQLSDRERDPVFRESMAVAQVMAQSVLPR